MKKLNRLTQTALLLSLLINLQLILLPLGQYAVGSVVNAIIIIAALACGPFSAVIIGATSPILAFLIGVGPAAPLLIPFIILGNITLALIWSLLRRPKMGVYFSLPIAATAKFLVLYLGIVKIALPLLKFPPKKNNLIATMFTFPQLATAAIGGIIASIVYHSLRYHSRRY